MDEITTLTTLDYAGIVGSVAAGIIAIKSLTATFEWAINKLGIKFKWVEDKKADHELLEKTIESVNEIKDQMHRDEEQYTAKDKAIESEINQLSSEIKNLSNLSNNILEKIDKMTDDGVLYKQAVVEMLYETINNQCNYYITELKGIPNSEVRWFTNRSELYQKMKGNHGLEQKVKYCLEKLPILPD